MTSVQVLRAAMLSPTLNVRELPRPITGIASSLDGIGLLMSGARLAALVAGTRAVVPSATSVFMNSRRESRVGNVISVINSARTGLLFGPSSLLQTAVFPAVFPGVSRQTH